MTLSTYTPNENQIIHHVDVDFLIRPIEEPVHLVQYDDKIPILAVHLYKSGLSYQLPSTASASIRVKKPDGTFVWNDALGWDAGRSILYFEMVENMLTAAGLTRAVVEIDINQKVAGSSLIKIMVDTNPVQRNDVESTSEYKHLLVYVEEAHEYWEGAKTEAGKAANSAYQAAASATNSANSATASSNSAAAALASQNAAKTSETNAKTSELAAKDSETKAKASENAAKDSEEAALSSQNAAKVSEDNAKASELAAANSETNAATSEANAAASELTASTKASEAETSAQNALTSETNAATSEANAESWANQSKEWAESIEDSEVNAAASAAAALASQNAAKTSEDNAKASEDLVKGYRDDAMTAAANAATSETNAATSETTANAAATTATTKASEAAESATTATTKASEAATSAQNAATSETNAATSETNAAAAETEAEKWADQAKKIAQGLVGTLKPMGTISFANLPALEDASTGDMYNISDQFTTTADFMEGSGKVVPAGSNVYKTAENQWDILAGTPVSGVKGSAESVYRDGLVDISKENVGLGNVDNTADADKVVKQASELKNYGASENDVPILASTISTTSFNYAMVLNNNVIRPISKNNMKTELQIPEYYAGSSSAGGAAYQAKEPFMNHITGGSDLNTFKTSGYYTSSSDADSNLCTNKPIETTGAFYLIVMELLTSRSKQYGVQIFIRYSDQTMWMRRWGGTDGNTWFKWYKIANENNIYQMTAGGLYDQKTSDKKNITWNSDPVDSINTSGHLLGWMSTWDSIHPITFAKVKSLLGVPTTYAGSSSAGGNASKANVLAPNYTGSGGQQGPNFISSSGGVVGIMMNGFKGISYSSNIIPSNCYVDCLFLDTYNGSDVPTTTLLGILKKTDRYPQLYIGNGVKNNANWSNISQGFLVHRVTSSSMNFNSYIETGMYHYSRYINSSASNKPSGSYDYGILMVWQYTTENVFQMFFGYQGNGGTIGAPIVFAGRMRYRQNTQYPWTSWNYFIGDQSWNKSNMLMLDNLGSASLPGLDNGVYQSSDNTGLNPFGIVGPITAVHFGDDYTISLGINGNGEVQIVSHNDSYTYDDVSCKIYTDKSPGTFLADYNSPTDSRKMSIGYSGPGISTGSWACMFNPSVWGQVAAIEINNLKALVSDQNVKNTITNIDNEKAVSFIMALNPVTYKINNGKSNRFHWGLIAQEVKSAMDFCGLTTQDFAGYIEYEEVLSLDKDGKEETEDGKNLLAKYALRYDEFIAPMIKMLQVQQETIQAQKEQIDELSAKVDQLANLVQSMIKQ